MANKSCSKAELQKLQSHINKIIVSIEGKKDGHQRELIKVLLKLKLRMIN